MTTVRKPAPRVSFRLPKVALALLSLVAFSGSAGAATNVWTSNGPFSAVTNTVAISSGTVVTGTNGGGIFRSINSGGNWSTANNGISSSAVVTTIVPFGGNVFAGTNGSGVYASADTVNWTPVSSGLPITSNVSALAINGTDIYAGIYGGGIYKSTDNGANWTAANGGSGIPLPNVNTKSLAVTGTTPATILAGSSASGMFYSIDDGANWSSSAGLPIGATVLSIACESTTICYAGTKGQSLYKSTDGGHTWSLPANNGLPAGSVVNAIHLRGTINVFALTDAGIYRSDDKGANWTALNTGLVASSCYGLAIDPSPAIMYLGTSGGIYKTTDSGTTWASSSTGLSFLTDIRATIVGSPATTIYAGGTGSGAFKSTDSGANWTIANSGLGNSGVNTFLFRSPTLYAGTTAGVFKTTDGGANWSPANTGLPTVDVRSIAADATSTLYAGTSNGVYKTPEALINWTSTTSPPNPDVRALVIDGSGNVYAGTAGGGVFKSTDSGVSWSAVNTGFTDTTIRSMAVDILGNILAGTASGGLFKTTDQGANWNSIGSSFSVPDVGAVSTGGSVDPSLVVAGTNTGGAYISNNSGGSWLSLSTGLPAQPVVQSIAIDTGSPKKLYAGLGGMGAAAVTLSPTLSTGGVSSLNFNTLFVDTASTMNVTVTNNGSIVLSVGALSLTGTDPTLYQPVADTCANVPTSITLAPGQSCTFKVTFRPTSTGSKSATLHLPSNDVNVPDTQINLLGNSIDMSATIGAPTNGAYIYGATTTISGTATASNTTLQKVEVSTNGGTTWTNATGTTSWTYTWTVPSDGPYTIQARSVDIANFRSSAASINVNVNNVLPVSAITFPATNAILKGITYQILGTASDAGAGVNKVEVSTDGGTTWGTATGTDTWSFDWTPSASGSYTIKSRATDNDNKVQAPVTSVPVTADLLAPTSLITAPSNGALINGTSFTITGTAADTGGSALATVEVSVDGESTWQTATGKSPWSYVWNFPAGIYTTYTIKSRANDNAGNVEGVPPSVTVTVDNIPPVSVIDAAPTYLKGTIYTFTGTASDTGVGLQKIQYSVNGGTWTDCSGTAIWSCAWTLPTDGSYTVRARAVDSAANTETTPPSVTVVVNNGTPAVAIVTPTNNQGINTSTYAITGTASDAGAGIQKVEVSIDGGSWNAASYDAVNGTWSYPWTLPSAEKAYTIQARATDRQGDATTSGTVNIFYDITAPTSAITYPLDGALLNGTSITITGTASDPFTPSGPGSGIQVVQVSVDGGSTWFPATPVGTWSNWTYNWILPVTEKVTTIKSRAVDVAGNVQTPFSAGVHVYQIPPVSTITSPVTGAHVRGTRATITGTSIDYGLGIQTVEISTDGGISWNTATGTTSWSYNWQLPPDGSYTILSRATDIAGYVQSSLGTVSVLVDNTLPDTMLVSTPLPYSNTSSPSFAFASDEQATYECKLDSGSFTTCTSPAGYSGLSDGTHTFIVRSVDLAGNVDTSPASYTWTVDTVRPQTGNISPLDHAVLISVSAPVSVSFSEAMDPATITTSSFSLDNGTTGTVSYDPVTKTATFTATPRLKYATVYTATLTTAVKDLAGNPLASALSWTFSTDPDGDIDGNGVVDIADALYCLRASVRGTTLTAEQRRHGDVAPLRYGKPNPNGTVDISDAVVILEKVVGLASW